MKEYEGIECPVCGSVHKTLDHNNYGWWSYVIGKWACDCGANGTMWFLGNKLSSLKVEE